MSLARLRLRYGQRRAEASGPVREGQWPSRNGRVPDLAGDGPSTWKGIVTGWVGDHLDGHHVLPQPSGARTGASR